MSNMVNKSFQTATPENEQLIEQLVEDSVIAYAHSFKTRHIAEKNNPDGKINMKIHNAFIASLGEETQYYSSLVRSLDSSMGNMLEKLAVSVAKLSYDVYKNVEGPLSPEQTGIIAELLEQYKRHTKKPRIEDYKILRQKPPQGSAVTKRHDSDYYLVDRQTGENILIELKIGGDLDNKKARSEKEAILEQYAILSNTLGQDAVITVYFGTAYNRYGDDKPWTQSRVKQFFADDELLIGKDFWNLVTKSSNGYEIIISAYKKSAHYISEALEEIRKVYLG